MFHILGCKLLRSRLILQCVLLSPAPNPMLCTEQALCKQDWNSINNNNWGAWNDSVILWFHLCCDLLSVTLWFCTWVPMEISQLQKQMGRKNSLPAGKQTHKMHNWSPNHRLFSKKEQWKTYLESSTFISGYYSCVDTERLLKADSEWCAAGYHETDIGWHLRGSWDRRKNTRILTQQILFKQCFCLFKGYPETHTMETFVCRAW